MELEDKIVSYLEEIIDDSSIFLIEVKVSGKSPLQKVKIILDGDDGVPIEKCAEVSRKLGAQIEESELIDSKYILEVSSPGLDQPLKQTRQYSKNVGRSLKIKLITGEVVQGKLLKVSEDGIVVSSETTTKKNKSKKVKNTEEVNILFSNIDKTNILVSFK